MESTRDRDEREAWVRLAPVDATAAAALAADEITAIAREASGTASRERDGVGADDEEEEGVEHSVEMRGAAADSADQDQLRG